MGRAAWDGAAGGQAALAADCTTDYETLRRMAAILRGQIGGTLPVMHGYEPAGVPGGVLDRRTYTAVQYDGPWCLACGMAGPPAEQTCYGGLDHLAGPFYGCPECWRPVLACARRPCLAAEGGR